jgi:hypothetical protein
MTTRRTRRLVAAAAVAACVAAPAAALAQATGGAAFGNATVPAAPTPATAATPLAPIVGSAALYARSLVMLGSVLRFHGTTAPGATVEIDRLDPASGAWTATARAVAGPDGSYAAGWRTDADGVFTVRAIVAGSAVLAGAPPTISVAIARREKATWYGPGLYGHRTACGAELTRALAGVAHRTLPCGTPVAVYYRGHAIVVPVVDRGPFEHGASWDLTAAAATALGLEKTDRVGVVALPVTPTG